ncbi:MULTISPECIES: hypothetical protein [Rhizobium]|uniref:Uncharacterized protein n=1 Tax=Rhizobium leguminosarum TaxID=384 RepID=A0A7K3VTE1_RHILE|nr:MULTISPECIES: hypothetical protein [Rhizobium]MBX5164822.1 hypothetical protein [Rhizobium sp. NZLR4b]NEK19887.1 hypothetical protein [Rhizobium leguminosarum]
MKTIACFALFMIAASSAHGEDQYRCKSFVADFMAISSTEKMKSSTNVNLAQAAGFLMGSYFAKTGADFESANTSGLGEFEKKVVGECSAHPNDGVSATVLRLAASLKTVDAVAAKPADVKPGGYEAMSLTDVKLDAKQMQGKKVEVSGVLITMGDMAMLGDSAFSSNKLFVDNKKLSREERKYILENCEGGCSITVRGKVGSVMLNDGIIADAIATQ